MSVLCFSQWVFQYYLLWAFFVSSLSILVLFNFVGSVRSCVFSHFPCLHAFTCYTYHFIWLSVIFYLFDYLYHFMRRQWTFTIFILLIWIFIRVISCTNIDSGLVEVYLILWHLTPFTGTLARLFYCYQTSSTSVPWTPVSPVLMSHALLPC